MNLFFWFTGYSVPVTELAKESLHQEYMLDMKTTWFVQLIKYNLDLISKDINHSNDIGLLIFRVNLADIHFGSYSYSMSQKRIGGQGSQLPSRQSVCGS